MLSLFNIYDSELENLPRNKKLLINTINAFSYNVTRADYEFRKSLLNCDILLPDGVGVVYALNFLKGKSIKKIAGEDLFVYEMNRLNRSGGKCLFLGSGETVLNKIKERSSVEYEKVEVQTYSPPYKEWFTKEDNDKMIEVVNQFQPDVLFIGMTAPKQEKWAYEHFVSLNAVHICCIGAVFDFYAGTVKRAPFWMVDNSLEWFYRLIKEPFRLWRRYLIGNTLFIWYIFKEKIKSYALP